MKNLKKLACLGMLSASIMGVGVANGLTVSNNTDGFSTVSVFKLFCSSIQGDNGITKPHDTDHEIPQKTVDTLCKLNPSNCFAEIFVEAPSQGSSIPANVSNCSKGSSADTGVQGILTGDTVSLKIVDQKLYDNSKYALSVSSDSKSIIINDK